MEIIVGTYEEYVLGYKFSKLEKEYSLEQSFANHAHNASIRSISCSGKFIVSGGVDETIRLFNLKTRTEVGSLLQHNGTINHLEFCGDSHLASCSDDGTVCIWNTHSWQCLKTLRGHKAAVTSVSIHPSGKLAFSVSRDKTLRTWNLVKGRSAYVTNIKDVAEIVLCAPDGLHFVVAVRNRVNIYKVDAASIVYSIDFGKNVLCVTFLQDHVLAIGGEKEEVEVHDIRDKSLVQTFKAHSKRTKGLCSVKTNSTEEELLLLATVSNDGFIKIWKFNNNKLHVNPKLLTEENTKCRLTCVAVWDFENDQKPQEEEAETNTDVSPVTQKRKKKVTVTEPEDEDKPSHVKRKKKRNKMS